MIDLASALAPAGFRGTNFQEFGLVEPEIWMHLPGPIADKLKSCIIDWTMATLQNLRSDFEWEVIYEFNRWFAP